MHTPITINGIGTKYALRPVDDPVFNIGNDNFTIQVWVNFNGTEGEQTLIEKWAQANPVAGYTLTKLNGDKLRLAIAVAGETDIDSEPLTIASGVWHQFCARRAETTFDLFFNGSKVATSSISAAVSPSSNPLLIGVRNGGAHPVKGRIDEVAFWSRALSDEEVLSLFNNGSGSQIPAQ